MTRIHVAAAFLSLSLMWAGCATTHDGSGGTIWMGKGLPVGVDEEALLQAASAESARVVSQVWAVAGGGMRWGLALRSRSGLRGAR